MAQSALLRCRGLHTFKNLLSEIPEGSLTEAINVVVDRDGIIEPRRGFTQFGGTFGSGSDRAKQLLTYKNRILTHYGSKLAFDSNGSGSFSDFNGSYSEVQSGLRIKSIEYNGNFYFTTSEGIKKISATSASEFTTSAGYITQAGGIKALDGEGLPNYSISGFFSPLSKVAYRIVWGITDANSIPILGSPSSRIVVENISSTDNAVVDLTFPVPDDVSTISYYYQVYRTGVFTAGSLSALDDVDPGDEMYLVVEDFVTSAQISAGSVSIQDITPEDFRAGGTLLYTNPVSGEGIEQSNEPPPFAKDIALYKNITFYGNTTTRHRLNLNLLSIATLISGTSTITVNNGVTNRTYTFRGTVESYTVTHTGTTGADYLAGGTNPGLYFTLNSSDDERKYYIWYASAASGAETDPAVAGRIGIQVVVAGGDTAAQVATKTRTAILADTNDFNIAVPGAAVLTVICANNGPVTASPTETIGGTFAITKDGLGTGEDGATQKIFLPKIPSGSDNGPTTAQQVDQAARSMVRIINADTSGIINAYYLSSSSDVPGQMFFEARVLTGPAFYFIANSTTTGDEFNPSLPTSGQTIISENEQRPNRIYYSKYQQPEAVPLVNFLDVGPRDQEILRIVALRDSLFIFKEDGIYRLTGDTAPFQLSLFDSSVSLDAPDSAAVLNNMVYTFSDQGVTTISDTGVNIISRQIEDKFIAIHKDNFEFSTLSFGIASETDRCYFLWTVTNEDDASATQCFRYNIFTNSWTRWTVEATCGVVNKFVDKIYIGASDNNFIEQERKNRDRTDYADRQFSLTIITDNITDNEIQLSSVANIELGDVIIQTQYLTITQFNRLLQKLDLDPFLDDADYFTDLEVEAGNDISLHMTDLVAKLNIDDASIITQTFTSGDVNTGTETITINSHGFTNDDIVYFYNAVPANLPAGLSEDTKYYIVGATTNTFQVSLTDGGSAVNITSGGTGTHTVSSNYNFSGTSTFSAIQIEFNNLVEKLNISNGVFFSNYLPSSGTVDYEGTVREIDDTNNIVTIVYNTPFLAGPIIHYRAIASQINWAPQTFGDPSISKQVSEGTIIFEDNNFSQAQLAYASDLSPSFEVIDFLGTGIGDWGQFIWSEQNWGGISAAKPIRTLLPLQKQRCRYINVRFKHQNAFEKYAIFGISLTYRPISQRAYR